ncbi:MAG: poly(3-hydroxyalkanoate) depolymerase [Streptosporangiaceae bacterium]
MTATQRPSAQPGEAQAQPEELQAQLPDAPRPAPGRGARYVTVDGQRLRVAVREGQGGQTPLLLINGIGASLEMLQPFVDALEPAQDVIRFDVPGVGGSALPPCPYRFTGLCGLIARMLTQLGYGQVDVLGFSWGGGVAQHFAAFQWARCRRLVLASTSTGTLMVPARPDVLIQLATRQRYLDPATLALAAPGLYGGSARGEPGRISAVVPASNRAGPPLGYLYQVTAALGWTSLPFLPLLPQPALIIAGDDDPLIPLANAYLMRQLILRSRLYVFRGGHLGLVAEAPELAPVVQSFLSAAPPGYAAA